MTTLHVSLLIDFAKEAGEKNEDKSLAARDFFCYLANKAYDEVYGGDGR